MDSDSNIPTHIGFILDGNRRWAKDQGLATLEGHRKGYENLQDVAKACFEKSIQYVSAFVFSTENWSRSKEEVSYLMDLALKIATKDTKALIDNNIKIVVLGIEENVPPKVIKAFKKIEKDSIHNTGGVLALCFNYGGYQELVDATKRIIQSGMGADEVTAEVISEYLYYPEVPPIDLIVRTSGEQRLSNFMLWRAAYSELYFTKKHWPDFSTADLEDALLEYSKRHRRFGGN